MLQIYVQIIKNVLKIKLKKLGGDLQKKEKILREEI